MGICVCLLIFSFVKYERQFDAFQAKNIFRLCEVQQKEGFGGSRLVAQTMFPMASTLKKEFPEVRDVVQIISWERVPLKVGNKPALMGTMLGTSGSFLEVFNFKLLSGSASLALNNPNSVVLTEETAHRLFGDQNAMGKVITHFGRDTINYTVTGILQNVPDQSHLKFDALYSMNTEESPRWMTDWSANWVFTYLQLSKGTDIENLEAKFNAYLNKHISHSKPITYTFFLQPLQEIHLKSVEITDDFLNWQKFDGTYLKLLISIALFVLAIAIINYINLTTAKSVTRAKEVAVRKTNGARQYQIGIQFLTEAVLFSLFALALAVIFVQLSLPLLSWVSERNIQFDFLKNLSDVSLALGIAIITGLVGGAFAALSLASIEPMNVLKGQTWVNSRSRLRNALVIIQFAVATGLTMATIIAVKQLKYIQHYNLGFNKNSVAVIHVSYTPREQVARVMDKIRNTPGVMDVTGSLRRLGNNIDQNAVMFKSGEATHKLTCATMFVDYNYLNFYNIPLIAGRNLSSTFGADRLGNSYIINETLARQLIGQASNPKASLNDLIGKTFYYTFQDSIGTIIGITKDFNFNSLHQKIEPLSITYQYDYYFSELSVRLSNSATHQILSSIEQEWDSVLPNQQFEYHFLNDHLSELYKADTQTSLFMAALTVIGLIVSCLGLIALAAYNIQARTKEIGLRKVLGASVLSIVGLLSKDFTKLVLIGVLIAVPASWYITDNWLQNFAYRVDVSLWLFIVVGIFALLLALVTVSYQAIKAAVANPVKTLRTE
jgi:putative ABC transport system permease protein